ncbi:MAG: prolipoprotein diacylglyceryl transferase [Gammaproteobacteria bacterium]|nr:MAG: prolipoprotein diacylglyceryl transferase [Gammaproteobacteria bacterium]
MFTYYEIDPIALQLGPLAVRWYGLMYVIGILGGWWLGRVQARRPGSKITALQVDDMVTWIALGVILGGRVGSVLFYNFGEFISDPMMLLRIWEGGMSFHGGFLGVVLAMWLYGRRIGVSFWNLTDFVAPLVTVGLGAGRIGNFINGELWGKVTDVPWAVVVNGTPRHASQLYEAMLEGLLLFIILWTFSLKQRPRMAVSGLFLICYGISRFSVEFVRLPDAHIGYMAWGWLTRGQVLTAPMIIVGIILIILAYRNQAVVAAEAP